MFTFDIFKNLKRVLVLIFVLVGAVSAEAKDFVIKNSTDFINASKDKATSKTLIFDIPVAEVLDVPGETSIEFRNLNELVFKGKNKGIIRFHKAGGQSWNIQIIKCNKVSFEDLVFSHISMTETVKDPIGRIKLDQCNVKYISNCNFNAIGLDVLQSQIGLISSCYFLKCENGIIVKKSYETPIIISNSKIDVIENTYFNNNKIGITTALYGNCFINTINNCHFINNKTSCWGFEFSKISKSDFHGLEGMTCLIGGLMEGVIEECTFTDYVKTAVTNCNISEIKNCKFVGTTTAISNTDTYKISRITEDTFICDKGTTYLIDLPTEGTEISNSIFENGVPAFIRINDNKAGLISNNIFKGTIEYDKAEAIKDSPEKKTIIESIIPEKGKCTIKGVAGPYADIELYQHDGIRQTATRFLKTIKADSYGNFETCILENELKGYCFVATATYDKKKTSGLSETYCFELPQNVYVKEDGKGDGSSWDYAMSPEFFAKVLPLAKDGTTFHIAEGRYLPIYDANNEPSSKGLLYRINSDIKIIGGYSPDELDEKVSNNPSQYHTVFTTDPSGDDTNLSGTNYISDPSKDDIGSSTGIFVMNGAQKVSFDGVEFIGCSTLKGDSKVDLSLSRCTFKLTNRAVLLVKDLTIDSCFFTKMSIGSSPSTFVAGIDGNFAMRNSTVTDVTGASGYVLGADFETHHAKSMTLVNNTFVGNKYVEGSGYRCLIHTGNYSTCRFYNNTFVNNPIGSQGLFEGYPEDFEFVGNLIVANKGAKSIDDVLGKVNFFEDESVYGNNLYDFEGNEGDLQTKEAYLVNFLDGKYVNGEFSANLVNNGGFTPTIALTSTNDGNGTDVRFSKSSTIVDTDQRGVERKNKTCVGAYESLLLDDYYVKVLADGSGSNWKDAMSFEAFCAFLPNAPYGVTFHFAEGDYELKNQVPSINSSVKFIGGYPVTNEVDVTKVKSDPTQFTTSFKREGTAAAPFFIFNQLGIDVEFHNVSFKETSLVGNYVLKNLVIDSCEFSNCIALDRVSSDKLETRNSYFSSEKGNSQIVFNRYKGTAIIENCSFVESSGKGSFLSLEQLSDARVSNCIFYSNSVSELIHICADNKLSLLNNTIIGGSEQSVVFSTNTTSKTDIVGNIIYGTYLSKSTVKEFGTDKYNVTSTESTSSNTFVKDFTTILEGENVDGVFVPVLANHGGFVPTVALLNDEFKGESIRFSRLSDVTKDANGVSRLSNTCAGAVELVKEKLQLKSATAKVYGIECRNGDGYIEVSWVRKSITVNQIFKLVVTDEDGNSKESELQDQSKGAGTFQITGLKAGTYTYNFYVKKGDLFVPTEKFNCMAQYQFYTSSDETPSGNKFIIKSLVDTSIPAPEPVSMSLIHPNWCDPADGGQDFSIKKWTDGVYSVRLYKVKNYEYEVRDQEYVEDPTEELFREDIEPSIISDGSNGYKTAQFNIRGLAGGYYRFVVSDGCQTWMNRVFDVQDNVQPTPTIDKLITPYSCYGEKDGSITIRVKDYYSSKAWIDDENVSPKYSDGYATFTIPEQGAGDKHTFKLVDVCEKEQTLDLDFTKLAKENGAFQFSYITAGAGRDKNDDPNEAACALDDHRIKMTVKGGTAPYTFEIYNSKEKLVTKETIKLTSTENAYTYTSGLLVPDKYVVYVSDATGCKYGDATHANFEAEHKMSLMAYNLYCTEDPSSHIKVNGSTQGSLALYRDVNDKDPYIADLMPAGKRYADVPGVYEYGVASFKDGCFAYSPIETSPLSQSFFNKLYDIEKDKPYEKTDQTCPGVNNGSFTIYPKPTFENDIYGDYSFVCTLVDVASGEKVEVKEGIYDLTAPVTFENLAPGKYKAYYSFRLGVCNSGTGTDFLKSAEILAVEKPVFDWDDDEDLVIRCEGSTVKSTVYVKNYDKNIYTWKLTKDKVDITSTVKVDVPTAELNAFVFKNLTKGSYIFSLVDECDKSYTYSFKVRENIKGAREITVDYSRGISCEGKSDAMLEFTVTNWTYGDKGVVTNSTTKKEEAVSVYSKGGVASIFKGELSGGKYTLVLTDLCGNVYPAVDVDLDELSKTSKFGISLAENTDADCNEDSRKLSATLSGSDNQAPYSYVLYKVEDEKETILDNTKLEVTDRTYDSGKLGYGKYKLTAVNTNGCEASVERTFSASHTLSGSRFVCGTNTHVELNYDGVIEGVSVKTGGKWADVEFAEVANKSIFDYAGVVTDVRVKESGCATDAALSDMDLTDMFKGVSSSAVPVNQTCYGVNNGSINVSYSGYKGNMQLVAYALDATGTKQGTYDAKTKKLLNLAPGTYDVKLGLEIAGCEVSDQSLTVKEGLVIKAVEEPVLTDNNEKLIIRCKGKTVTETINVTNYDKNLYTWKLVRNGEDITAKVKVEVPTDKNAFVFKGLTYGSYEFSLIDDCGNPYTFKFTVSYNIKKEFEITSSPKGVSCEGKNDGSLSFSVTNWSSQEDKAVLTNLTTKEEVKCTPFTKGQPAVTSWYVPELASGKYSFVVTDLCGTEYPEQIVDLDELNKASMFNLSLENTANDAACNEDNRKISATVSGLETQAPYSYVLYKVDGEEATVIDDKQKEVSDRTYTSAKLDYGKYKLTAVNTEGCEASVERTFSASHTLSGTRLVCGTNTHVELSYDGVVESVSVKTGGKWADVEFAEDANKSIFNYSGVVTEVRVKENGCATEAKLADDEISGDLFEGVNAIAKGVDQTCYDVDNGSINVTYTGYTGNLQVVAYAVAADGTKKASVLDEKTKSLVISNLAPGTYDVKLGLEIAGCEVSDQSLTVKEGLVIEGLEEPIFDNYSFVNNQCEGLGKGRMHLEMNGWKDGIYKWTLQRAGQLEKDLEVFTHCGDKLENGATAFDLWTLPEGRNVFKMWNGCGDTIYKKAQIIGADYIAPIALDTCDSKAYTCADRTDGSLSFVASPWDVENVALLKKGSTVIDNVKPVVKEGKAYFVLANQGAGVYTISTTDLCERTEDKEINFTEFSEKNGLLTIAAEIDKDASVCEIGKRVIKVTANGGTSPYVYSVTKSDGTAVETSESLEEKTYSTNLVGTGKYKASVTDNTECTAVYDGDLTVAAETLNVTLGKLASEDQTCYGKDNAVVSVAYTAFNTELAKLRLVVTEKTEAEEKKSYEVYAETNEGSLELNALPTGSYDVKVELVGLNGCVLNNSLLLETSVELKALEKPEFIEANYTETPNRCEGLGKGRMHLEMTGWKDGIYSWTLKRAGQKDADLEVNTHCGAKLDNGATAFDLWSLPEGENVFTMWDACKSFLYTKTATIKSDYTDPLTIDMGENKAYTCFGRNDGSVTFVASPWDVEDEAVLKKGATVIENVSPVVEDGKAYFVLANQGAGVYSISTTDLCDRTADKEFDLTEFSEKNGMLIADVEFDADAAKCDIEKRVFKVTATGGTAPYIYAITKADGNAVETSESVDAISYTSQLLADGQYKVSITDKTECTAVYEGDLNIDPAHTMKALMREVVCDDHKTVTIISAVDNSTLVGSDYIATDAVGNEYKPLSNILYNLLKSLGISYYRIPVDVTLKGISAKVDEDCRVYSELADLPLDKSALEKAVVTVDKVIDQRCYKVNNGEIELGYSGPETSYTVAMRLKRVNEDGETIAEYESEPQHGTELTFKFEELEPGEYELYLVHKVGNCDAGLEPRKIQNVTVKPMLHEFERIAGDTTIQSTCYSAMNGIASIKVHGWCKDYCTWELFKDGESLGHDVTAAPVNGDTAVWGGSKLKAGSYVIKWTNYCNKTVSKDFVINELKEPKLDILSSSYTDLKCNYDKAHIDFHYEGGSPINKRILFIYEGDWEYTKEPLKEENTYRLYEFTQGPGLQGHKKVEGTDYVLTDEDRGLYQGKYTIIYQDTTEKCSGDDVSDDIYVYRPYVKMNLSKQDVLCYSENYGVINIVPTRTGKNAISYKYMDEYPDHSDIRDQGLNYGEVIFKNPSAQAEMFSDRNKFLSKVFSDVESISITCKKMPQKDLYQLMKDSIAKRGTNLKYPLRKFYKDGGYEYAVSDWIGFNMMPVDMYYVTLNDIYGCQYTDSIEVKGPEDGLRVTAAKYPMGENPECNAESRRIQFTCTGGYYPYYYNVVNLDEPLKDDMSTEGSGMSAADYVTGAVTEKYIEGGKQFIDYTSKMLKPGRYEVSVMDTMGCIAKWEQVIDVEAKHVLMATPHVDVCDPANDNKLEILAPSNNAKSYTLYVGHRTHCEYYPYCSVDDDNAGLIEEGGKKQHIHKCEADLYKECEHFTNCIEKRSGIEASAIKFKDFEGNKWVSKSGYGLSGIPTGTIGVLATMPDGCTAFDEYTFKSSGLPTSIVQVKTDSIRCNGGDEGALTFELFGGHGYYKSLKLDGNDISSKSLPMITRKENIVNNKVTYTYETTNMSAKNLLNNVPLFETLKKYYDGDALYDEAVAMLGEDAPFSEISKMVSKLKTEYGKTSYSFRIDDLYGSVNWEDEMQEKNKKHILTVVDEQDCEASMEFDIYQPTKLNLIVGASVICPDGSGRIYASSTTGGVPPYEYRMNEATEADFSAVFNAKIDKKPTTYEGEELVDKYAYEDYYVNEYHKGDHIPAGRGQEHFMWVKDANGCEMKSERPVTLSEIWNWEKVHQDQLISTWHDFGDVLVVIDQTDYSEVHEKAVYDSMKVIVVMDDEGAGKFEGVMQPKELYTYGVANGHTIETDFGNFTSSWGISPLAQEQYNEYLSDGTNQLEPIHTYFDHLVTDDAQRRMSFVKFQTPEGVEVKLSDLIGNREDYHLNFLVRVVAYVGGCDIVTEHNPLVLNLKGEEPFPDAYYKSIISVDAFPNPVAKDGKCTLKVTLTNEDNDFTYSVFSLDGRKLYTKTVYSSQKHDIVPKDDGNTDYIYEVVAEGITETSIVKVTTETNTAVVKVLAK